MKHTVIPRVLIILLGIAALVMGVPLVMAAVLGETGMIKAFAIPMAVILVPAALTAFFTRKQPLLFTPSDGFLLVFSAWLFTCLLGAAPYCISGIVHVCDAVFESVGGFATTGVTTIANIEALPRSLLLWRSLTYWLGGMGIVMITVAFMPILGVGGFQLLKAETSGPEKEKVTPRVTATAKFLWFLYCGLSVVLILLYRLGNMSWFDAVCHGLATIASGGASTRNSGIASFNSGFIDAVATIFMLLAGLNFNLYYKLLRGKFRDVFTNTEGRAYILIFLVSAAVLTASLVPVYGGSALRYASFQAASILSTTGSAIADYEAWPELAKAVLLCLMFAGGCSGSTAGGIKVIRHAVLFKQAGNELRRLVYPRGIFSIHLNRKVGRKDVVYGVAGFVFLYLMVVAVTALVTAASGTDIFSSFSAALVITGNIGTGFGAAGPARNYGAFPDHIKWLFSFVMIAGRLELWTVFVLFTPEYWRR
ncbi:MAG: TrkH family potassium uptake protein [Treponema sp.]|jgi:trk system potassium uptake protein TrkH|nr:TrkH family potassium uptake protein [Treponema sp.]